jgi:hypothetical protein
MPDKQFLTQLHKILLEFKTVYNRLEHSSALLSEGISTLAVIKKALTPIEDNEDESLNDLPSIVELKNAIWEAVDDKVVDDCISDLHRVAYMCLPMTEVMEYQNVDFIGDEDDTLKIIGDFFGSATFSQLLELNGIEQEQKSTHADEILRKMGCTEVTTEPDAPPIQHNKRPKLSVKNQAKEDKRRLEEEKRQEQVELDEYRKELRLKWSKKWLSFRQHVLRNPLNLSTDSSTMDQHEFSSQTILYLDQYREVDPLFADIAIQILIMLPSSSTSEHLFSIVNYQVRPNMGFETLKSRTMIASNSGILLDLILNNYDVD